MTPDALVDVLTQIHPTSPFFECAARVLDRALVSSPPRSEPPPVSQPKLLTIAMATYDDFDGVYFSIQAIRLYHPEIADEVDFLVLDNHPEGPQAVALQALAAWIRGYRYWPYRQTVGTAVRDFLFRQTASEFVMCMDSHVMFVPGALRKLIDYLKSHRDTRDLLQGPLIYDDLSLASTHFAPEWRSGMYGAWASDERASDPDAPPIDIPMQGLGVFVCRREAWPGFNPRLSGFGGEEGYIHEKIRRAGGRTLCLPFLRWMHRFGRSDGTWYPNDWKDRVRNYLIIAKELGWDPLPVIDHFRTHLGTEVADTIVRTASREIDNPFSFFDAIYCVNLDRDTTRWEQASRRFTTLGLQDRVRRFSAIETPTNHHLGCALSHRAILAEAKWQGLQNVLVFDDDVRFTPTVLADLAKSLRELQSRPWHILYLGGHRRGQTFPTATGCQHLECPQGLTCTPAIAFNHTMYNRILDDVPARPSSTALWLRRHHGIDQYYARQFDGLQLVVRPVVATQPWQVPLVCEA